MKTFRDTRPFMGQDPHITKWENTFLLIQSAYGNKRIIIRQIDDLSNMIRNTMTTVWIEGNHQELWAPELHNIDDKWFIYYAATHTGRNEDHRMYVLEADHPLGPYHSLGKVITPNNEDFWAIDQTIFQHNQEWFTVWSGWHENSPGFPQHLYGAVLEAPNRIGPRSLLSSPHFNWEKTIAPLLEGPQILKNDQGKIYLTYSCDASWTQEYKVGLLEHNGGPILDPESWQKYPEPILTGGGHGTFVGTFYVYHRKLSCSEGWFDREITVKPFHWANGVPKIDF